MDNTEDSFYDTLEEILSIVEDMMDNKNFVNVFESDLEALIEIKNKLNNIQTNMF